MKIHEDNYVAAGFGREFLWLDLANTLEWDGYGKMTDHLNDSAWIATILNHWNLATQLPRPVPLRKLAALRALLRRLASKLISGASLDSRDLCRP